MLRQSLAVLLSIAVLTSAHCDRVKLIQIRDDFWETAISGAAPSSLASTVKIAVNNAIVPLNQTPYSSLGKSKFSNLTVQAIDTDICEIATFRVATDQILSTRLKLNPQGAIAEVEFLQAVPGDQFFHPSGFPNETPAMFLQKQMPFPTPQIPESWTPTKGMLDQPDKVNTTTCKATSGTARAWNRSELIYATSSYADGLKGQPFDSCLFRGSSCPRNENGVTTTLNCARGTGIFGFSTRGRRWTVDTETGVVLGAFYFEFSGLRALLSAKNLFLHEYFKVDKGALAYIFAPMVGRSVPPTRKIADIEAEIHATESSRGSIVYAVNILNSIIISIIHTCTRKVYHVDCRRQ